MSHTRLQTSVSVIKRKPQDDFSVNRCLFSLLHTVYMYTSKRNTLWSALLLLIQFLSKGRVSVRVFQPPPIPMATVRPCQ